MQSLGRETRGTFRVVKSARVSVFQEKEGGGRRKNPNNRKAVGDNRYGTNVEGQNGR